MNAVKLVVDGARLEPRLYALVMQVVFACERHGLEDLEPMLRRRLYGQGAIVRDASDPRDPVWRLTEWAELTLVEVLSLVLVDDWTAAKKRLVIENALSFAGFEDRKETA